ncbi:MAG: GNAT family N-acetyltransferase [Firmicutes bacterium]|nr:GNAT family N-acetyltransferase [Bacillota bacterium]
MVRYRHATKNDLEPLLDLIEKGFSVESDSAYNSQKGEEHRVLFSYLYAKKNWSPDLVYLAEESGRLVAAVGFFPQNLIFDGVEIPVWAVSPVVTDPEFRGKGYAGSCLTQALADVKSRGIPAVFLWGLPWYYPRFGFVPVLPRYKTKLAFKNLTEKIEVKGRMRSVKPDDLPRIAALYEAGNSRYWLQPKRNLEWWRERFEEIDIEKAFLKEVPFPKKENFLVWENNKGEVNGYLNYLVEANSKIVINEAAVSGMEAATEMIAVLAADFGFDKTIYIRGTPEHELNLAAYRLGGIHLDPAPRAGMVKIIDWRRFIELLFPIFNKRIHSFGRFKDGDCLEITLEKETCRWVWRDSSGWDLSAGDAIPRNPEGEKLFTKLLLGFYDQYDLSLIRTKRLTIINNLFPKKYPFIWDNNYLY